MSGTLIETGKQEEEAPVTQGKQVRLSEDTLNDDMDKARRMSKDTTDSTSSRRRGSVLRIGQTNTQLLSMRRQSRAFSTVTKQKPKLENTYKMEPDEGTDFQNHHVRSEIRDVFDTYLNNVKYDPEETKNLGLQIATSIKNRVKDLEIPRYKVIVNVFIGQIKDQGMACASRCLWDDHFDSWACESYKNDSICALAVVHGVYFD